MKLQTPPSFVGKQFDQPGLADIVPEATFESMRLEQKDVSGLHAPNMSFDESFLKQLTAVSAKLEKLSITDSRILHCDFSGAKCNDAAWLRLICEHSRLSGVDLSRAALQDITFSDCRLDMANFRFASLKRIRFVDCDFAEADFLGAHLEDVGFERCKVYKTVFEQCQPKFVDFRGSEMRDVRGWRSLDGCRIDSMQLVAVAPELAATLGLRVVD